MELPDDITINHLINNNMIDAKKGLLVWCDKLLERGGTEAIALANELTFYLKQNCIIQYRNKFLSIGLFGHIYRISYGPIVKSPHRLMYAWFNDYGVEGSYLTIRLDLISSLD